MKNGRPEGLNSCSAVIGGEPGGGRKTLDAGKFIGSQTPFESGLIMQTVIVARAPWDQSGSGAAAYQLLLEFKIRCGRCDLNRTSAVSDSPSRLANST